jgi:hypothetical protein
MTKVFDFSVSEIHDHIYAFAEMSEEEIKEKRNVFEAHQISKPTPAPPASPSAENKPTTEAPKPGVTKPVFRPKIKPPGSTPPTT